MAAPVTEQPFDGLDTVAPARPGLPPRPRILTPTTEDIDPDERRGRHLERLAVFGAERDERFARITQLASTLFGVPMASVTLLDEDNAWFPGATGFQTAGPVPRKSVFCDKVVHEPEPVIVRDATADPRFCDMKLVTSPPYIRFYAGVPLADDEGVVVGTFCLFDTVPRTLDRVQQSMLLELASWARRELVDSNEMAKAREVQQALLPPEPEAPEGYALAGTCRPTQAVGGDFYDHGILAGRLVLTLVDVMGKGIGAAIVAASIRAVIRTSMLHALKLSAATGRDVTVQLDEVMRDVDALMQRDLGQTGRIVAGFAASLEPGTGELCWLDAGHGLALVANPATGEWRRLAGDDLPTGLGIDTGWTEHRDTLAPGETFMVVSDGLLDLLGGTESAFEQIAELAVTVPDPDELVAQIDALAAAGTSLDDVTAVALRRAPVGGAAGVGDVA
ncbi:MAG: PP2C family protein-serine/threonine phosphatase [Jatrophihabitans sp.]|uniref:PP2C family protein-serine/threonine phosphatase n=1 Tax=Jatrophihabitans sp. TaxID=1932789 RepID=UPI003F808C9F